MTYPPHDPSSGPNPGTDPQGPAYGYGSAPVDAPAEPAQPDPAKHRTRRRLAIGATVVGALVLGGGGYAVASFMSGGGPQPEDVLPADTIAFVKLDLDPAASQKAAVMSLLEKFPSLGESTDDMRQDLVDQLLDYADADLDFADDVEPWLGDRVAVAAVPDADSEAGVAPVLVLAVDDQQAMGDTLREVRDDLDLGFAVRDDFVLVTEDQETADRLAAEETSLARDDDYVGDLAALEGDQIAVVWADLSAADQLFAAALGDDATFGLAGQPLSGRLVYGLHAEEDALELVGLDFSVSDVGPGPRPTEPTELVQNLPDDTLAALSAGGVGDLLVTTWDDLQDSGAVEGWADAFPDLVLPDDLRIVFGTDLMLAAFGDLEDPQFGLRVVTDEPERATDILRGLNYAFELDLRTVPAPVDDGFVLATDVVSGRTLAADGGGLGDTDAFQAAVPDAETAALIGYADLAAIIESLPDTGRDFRPSDYSALEALGVSSSPTDEGMRFVLRITTR